MSNIPVTVVVPVKNEEMNLARCLSRLSSFEEVVVVDSGSSDRTLEIAKSYGVRVVQFSWGGGYPKKRNWFLLTQRISTDWVLFLDADEYVTSSFTSALGRELSRSKCCGYWLNYEKYFLGRRLRYGVKQRKLALIKVGKALYEKVDDKGWSNFDMEVHEHPVVDGQVGELAEKIEHNDYKGLSNYIEKHCSYAGWEVARFYELANNDLGWNVLTKRQKFKYRHICKSWYPLVYFFYDYLFMRGFLDGRAGVSHSFYKLWYFTSVRLMIKEGSGSSEKYLRS